MPLSISSSEVARQDVAAVGFDPQIRRAVMAAISLVLLVVVGAEFVSRYVFPRFSQIEARIESDERETMSIRAPRVGPEPVVLLAGNSLLLRGLDYPRIRREMAPEAKVVRMAIENTEYLDWYYGLHHMLAAGVRPSMVVLCLNLGQTVSSQSLGDYSARHLLGVSELLPLARDARMDATRISGLLLAHWSAFYASRATIRNFVLNVTDPPYADAMHTLANNAQAPLPADDVLIQTARVRLQSLQRLCDQYGVQLVLLIPPALGRYNDLEASAAQLQHIDFEYPIPVGTIGPEFFADGTHLNARGAALFTNAIEHFLHIRVQQAESKETAVRFDHQSDV